MDIANNPSFGFQLAGSGLLFIAVNLLAIGFAWWALQAVRFDVFVRRPASGRAKVLQIMLAVVLGHGIASFLIDYASWTSLLKWMF